MDIYIFGEIDVFYIFISKANGGGLYFEVGGKIFVKTIVSEPFWVVPHTAQNGSDTIARLTL